MIAIEDKIILEALEPEKLTSGGVILPDTSTEASDRGKVLHVGPGRHCSNGVAGRYTNASKGRGYRSISKKFSTESRSRRNRLLCNP